MDPIAAAINDLPGALPNPYANGGGGFIQQPDPMFGNTPPAPPAPGQPVYAQQPIQQPQYAPPQPPAPQQPQAQPGQPVYAQPQQPVVAAPGQPLTEYSLTPPVQTPQQEQMPAWAAGLVEQVNGLQAQIQTPQQQPPAAGNAWPWPDIPQTWAGLQTAIDRVATEKADAKVGEYQQTQQAMAQQQEQARVQADQMIDSTLNQLRQTGILPLITDATNPNDAGKLAEKELLGYTIANGGSDPNALVRMAPTLRALHDSGIYYDNNQRKLIRRGSQSAAANAPIAGGTPVMGGNGQTPAAPSAKQFATMDLSELATIGMSQLQ